MEGVGLRQLRHKLPQPGISQFCDKNRWNVQKYVRFSAIMPPLIVTQQ
jgi:hypothetical protein